MFRGKCQPAQPISQDTDLDRQPDVMDWLRDKQFHDLSENVISNINVRLPRTIRPLVPDQHDRVNADRTRFHSRSRCPRRGRCAPQIIPRLGRMPAHLDRVSAGPKDADDVCRSARHRYQPNGPSRELPHRRCAFLRRQTLRSPSILPRPGRRSPVR